VKRDAAMAVRCCPTDGVADVLDDDIAQAIDVQSSPEEAAARTGACP
jgi:hypothetical protein